MKSLFDTHTCYTRSHEMPRQITPDTSPQGTSSIRESFDDYQIKDNHLYNHTLLNTVK